MPALIYAAERGKQSVSLIELKARFDERRNIGWSRSLEQAGVHVVYGFPNLKIHAKTTLIVRREGDELRRYVHLGTGNYNILDRDARTRTTACSRPIRTSAPTSPISSTILTRLRAAAAVPQAARGALRPARRAGRAHSRGPSRGGERRGGADPDQGEQPQRRGADRGALPRITGRREDRHRRAQHLHAPTGCARTERDDPRAQHPRPLPRAQPHLHLRRRREAVDPHRQRGPDAAEPRSPDRAASPRSRTGARSTSSSVRSTSSWPTTRRRGS